MKTITYRRAEKRKGADDEGCKIGVGWTRSRAGAGLEQSRSGAQAFAGQELGRNRAGAELSRVKQNRAESGQELGRNRGGARNVRDRNLKGAGQEYSRGRAEAGAGK